MLWHIGSMKGWLYIGIVCALKCATNIVGAGLQNLNKGKADFQLHYKAEINQKLFKMTM